MPSTYTLISSNVLTSSAASVTFSAIPSTYTDLVLRCTTRLTSSTGGNNSFPFLIGLNGSTGTATSETALRGNGSVVAGIRNTAYGGSYFNYSPAEDATANTFSNIEIYVPNYANSSYYKPYSGFSVTENNATTAFITADAALRSDTAAVTSIILAQNNAIFTFNAGSSFYLYGIKNS